MARARRQQLTEAVAGLLVGNVPGQRRPPVLFAVVHHKASAPFISPYERAYEEYFARCNGMLDRLASQGDRHNCVVIADDSRLEESLQSAMVGWREDGASSGAANGPLSAYAEVPLFVDSKASRLVQLADFVAHWVYRAYESGDDSVLKALAQALTRRMTCSTDWSIWCATTRRANASRAVPVGKPPSPPRTPPPHPAGRCRPRRW